MLLNKIKKRPLDERFFSNKKFSKPPVNKIYFFITCAMVLPISAGLCAT